MQLYQLYFINQFNLLNRYDSTYFFKKLESIILEEEKERFEGIITDNANAMMKSTEKINRMYPNITNYGCSDRTINLLA